MTARTQIALAKPRLAASLRICLVLLMLAATSRSARPFGDIHEIASKKQQEWKELDQRWAVLIRHRSNPDNAKWAALEDDLRGFATKYGIHLEEHASKSDQSNKKAPGGASEFAQCPPRDDSRNYRCNLFPGPKGVCRYVCIPLDAHVKAESK